MSVYKRHLPDENQMSRWVGGGGQARLWGDGRIGPVRVYHDLARYSVITFCGQSRNHVPPHYFDSENQRMEQFWVDWITNDPALATCERCLHSYRNLVETGLDEAAYIERFNCHDWLMGALADVLKNPEITPSLEVIEWFANVYGLDISDLPVDFSRLIPGASR